MRDDIATVNLGKAESEYTREFFWRSYRDLEMFFSRLLSKGPIETSTLTTDDLVVNGDITGSINWFTGTGSPESVVTASVGSLYTRTDGGTGTTLYVKETGGTGNTGWVAK